MASQDQAPAKVCVICNQDCSGKPRVKDQAGNYYCRTCYETAKAQRGAVQPAPSKPVPPVAAAASRPRVAGPAAAVPPAASPKKAAPPPPPPPPEPDEDLGYGLLDAMSEAESGADGVQGEQKPCPSCKAPMPADAIICMRCGFNQQIGQRMGDAQIEEGSEAAPAATGRGRVASKPAARSGGAMSFLNGKEWLAGVAPVAFFAGLFLLGRSSPGILLLSLGLLLLYCLTVWILCLVYAFMDGVGQGFLCLCIGIYQTYWVFSRNQKAVLKWLYGGGVLSLILLRLLVSGDSGEAYSGE